MNLNDRIASLAQWGKLLQDLSQDIKLTTFNRAQYENAWFTPENCESAFHATTSWLTPENLTAWASNYRISTLFTNKKIGLVMAGNIPLVGFHDFLCVLMAGHTAVVKLSSQDKVLLPWMVKYLTDNSPGWATCINFTEGLLGEVDAVIATGSDNSSRYFEYYFKSKPHIIRKNRTSVAIIDDAITDAQLASLGLDVFSYFGLGCRNVSKLFIPLSFDLERLKNNWQHYSQVVNHHKFANNYDYQRAIRLVSNKPFTDFGFCLLEETEDLVSPISVLYFERYLDLPQLESKLSKYQDKIQCFVASTAPHVSFGGAQTPSLTDYPDGIDVMRFLSEEI